MKNDREFNILLIDFYGSLLTKHQNEILDEYYNLDHSMSEIADNYSISKAAVQDLISRSLVQLNGYEKHLKLIQKDNKLDIILNEMYDSDNELLHKYAKRIDKVK